MMYAETIRAEFEKFMSDDGKWPQAIERDGEGYYILMQSASSWHVWRTAYHLCLQSPEVQALAARVKELGRFIELSFDAHPNLDLDVAAIAAEKKEES